MAWWVVAQHFLQFSGTASVAPAWLLRGDWAVNVFMILSGFVITHLVLEQREPFWPYIRRRAFRIVPIYWFSLVAALVASSVFQLAWVTPWVGSVQMQVDRISLVDENFITHLILHISLMHGLFSDYILPYSSSAILSPAWSLSLEWQFYLVAPFLVLSLAKPGFKRWAITISLLLISAALKLYPEKLWQYPAFFPLSTHFFLLGIFSRVALLQIQKSKNWGLPVAAILVWPLPVGFSVPALIWLVFLYASLTEWQGAGRTMPSPIHEKIIRMVTENRFAVFLGQASYSTYLIHVPFLVLVAWLFRTSTGEWSKEIATFSAVVSFLFLVPLSRFLYRFVEMPFIRLGRKTRKATTTVQETRELTADGQA